jgi:hypothetical protein
MHLLSRVLVALIVTIALVASVIIVARFLDKRDRLAQIEVSRSGRRFDCWIEGRNGFVYACARELRTNGWTAESLICAVGSASPDEQHVSIQKVDDDTVRYRYGNQEGEIDIPGP